MESGFYKYNEANGMLFGPNSIINATYELFRDEKDTYTYPVDGWYWFDTEEEAYSFFGVPSVQV